jgi:hypothetical protein
VVASSGVEEVADDIQGTGLCSPLRERKPGLPLNGSQKPIDEAIGKSEHVYDAQMDEQQCVVS